MMVARALVDWDSDFRYKRQRDSCSLAGSYPDVPSRIQTIRNLLLAKLIFEHLVADDGSDYALRCECRSCQAAGRISLGRSSCGKIRHSLFAPHSHTVCLFAHARSWPEFAPLGALFRRGRVCSG